MKALPMATIKRNCRACAQQLEQNEIQNAEEFFQMKKEDYTELTMIQVRKSPKHIILKNNHL
jgi:hypothetical protein